ncbi:MAG: ABC transporter ATP-binding protein [Alphaproteobacteria bacterium]|nr:ABC transporter ATP-binding protein [Alphaproteobacteria bacterium]
MTDPLIALSDVTVRFGGVTALSGVSLSLAPGEVVAVIGPNGAGKTSLFNAITGFVPLADGAIRLRGARIDGLMPHDISTRGVRRTFQNGGLFPEQTVLENVLSGLHAEVPGNPLAILFGLPGARRAERAAVARARALLDLMGIRHLERRPAGSLSGGQQRMVEIVRAIATDPPLLLLDEPAVGLAPPVREQLAAIVKLLAKERGIGVLLIEHAIELVMAVADRIVVLNYGEKIADAAPEVVRADKAVLEAYLGHA